MISLFLEELPLYVPKSCPTPELSAVSSSLDDTVHSSIPNHRPFSNVHDALEVTEFVESFLANLLADLLKGLILGLTAACQAIIIHYLLRVKWIDPQPSWDLTHYTAVQRAMV